MLPERITIQKSDVEFLLGAKKQKKNPEQLPKMDCAPHLEVAQQNNQENQMPEHQPDAPGCASSPGFVTSIAVLMLPERYEFQTSVVEFVIGAKKNKRF